MKNKATVKKTRGRRTETLKRTVTTGKDKVPFEYKTNPPKRTKRHFPAV